MRTPWRLVPRHLRSHWVRSGLTLAIAAIALLLLCILASLVTTLEAAVNQAATNRLIVQSAVSLFVELPRDYQAKIASVPGVQRVTPFQWFGAYYQDPKNFFAQFAVEHEVFFEMYERDIVIAAGPEGTTPPQARAAVIEAMGNERRAALVGAGLVRTYGWEVGDTVPLTGVLYQKVDGTAWEFVVAGVYEPLKQNFDDRTLFFRWDYLTEMLDSGACSGPRGPSTFSVTVAPGHDPERVIAGIDALFENGPQRTWTATEATFQAIFASMMGNLPLFVGTIGGAVVFAVLFSLVNTMLMAARQRVPEVGILKALGFSDGSVGLLLLGESLLLSTVGGGIGVALAWTTQEPLRWLLSMFNYPTYAVAPSTVVLGLGVAVVVGIVAGLGPALSVARLGPTAALRSEG